MSNFRISFEAWASRESEAGVLTENEQAHLQTLRASCESVAGPEWWNDYLALDNNPRGLHYGVHFGFEVTDGVETAFKQQIRRIVIDCGFRFEEGETTIWT